MLTASWARVLGILLALQPYSYATDDTCKAIIAVPLKGNKRRNKTPRTGGSIWIDSEFASLQMSYIFFRSATVAGARVLFWILLRSKGSHQDLWVLSYPHLCDGVLLGNRQDSTQVYP